MEALEVVHDLALERGEQRLLVVVMVVERPAVQVSPDAQVVHREAVEAAFLHELDERVAQGALRTRDATILAAWGSGAGALARLHRGRGGCDHNRQRSFRGTPRHFPRNSRRHATPFVPTDTHWSNRQIIRF